MQMIKKMFVLFLALCITFVSGNGVPSQRISAGQPAPITDFPFAVAMLTNGGAGPFVQRCGATVLTFTALLSAASCYVTAGTVQNVGWWEARVGSATITDGAVLAIRLITPHEGFSALTNEHNIAVLRTTLTMAGITTRAHIAGQAYPLPEQTSVLAIGWGKSYEGGANSNVLQVTNIFTVSQSMCESRYLEHNPVVSEAVVCAGWLDVGIRGQCEGDEGSPLVHNGVVVGVHSYNQECASHRYPGLNTRVSTYTAWILRHATAI